MSDAINPDHYKRLPAEAIEIIEAMIAGAPDNKAAYLHGQAAKYDLRLWEKGESIEDFLSDWQKHIWYALRLERHLIELVEKQTASEQQEAADLQSPLAMPIDDRRNSDKIPEGYRKLGDSSVELRKLGDLRWSISQKRYVEIGEEEIGYANRDNWAAYRKIETPNREEFLNEIDGVWNEGSSNDTDQDDHPHDFKVGDAVISWQGREGVIEAINIIEDFPITVRHSIREQVSYKLGGVKKKHDDHPGVKPKPEKPWTPKVGERVVYVPDGSVWTVDRELKERADRDGMTYILESGTDVLRACLSRLAPHQEIKPKQSLTTEPPDGWRWLEVGEKFFLGDTTVDGDGSPYLKSLISKQYCEKWKCQMSRTFIRRNRFEVGEKVVVKDNTEIWEVDSIVNGVYQLKNNRGFFASFPEHLAPYIEAAE